MTMDITMQDKFYLHRLKHVTINNPSNLKHLTPQTGKKKIRIYIEARFTLLCNSTTFNKTLLSSGYHGVKS